MRRSYTVFFQPVSSLRSFRAAQRFYSTVAGDIRIHGNPGNWRLAVPLPSEGKRVFTLPENNTIASFLNNLQVDDATIKSVHALDTDDVRLSGTLQNHYLFDSDWKLKINDTVYRVHSPVQAEAGRYFTTVDEKIQKSPHFKELKQFVTDSRGDRNIMKFQDFLAKCSSLGINEPEARRFLRTFHNLGIILHFEDHMELHENIFLHPSGISTRIEEEINWPTISLPIEEKESKLESWREELANLEEIKTNLLWLADKRVQAVKWTIFLGLCAQFVLFARFTWWDYDWGVMEPVTWFTTVVETSFTAYCYYLYTRSEYSNMDMRQALLSWQFDKLAKNYKFSVPYYEGLKKRVKDLEMDIHTQDSIF